VPNLSLDIFGLPIKSPLSRQFRELGRQNVKDAAAGKLEFSLSPEQVLVDPDAEEVKEADGAGDAPKDKLGNADTPQVGRR